MTPSRLPNGPVSPWHAACAAGLLAILGTSAPAQDPAPDPSAPGDALLAEYFATETAALEAATVDEIRTADDWTANRTRFRGELFEMLGLDPMPERTPLEARVEAVTDGGSFTVERLHFQSMPGLYVTGNLYLPKERDEPVPAILYLCGHGPSKIDGVSYGNKATYRHHGAWFARNGYACLVLDSLQLGEIEAIHHGTYRYGRWWWNSRGYTPAGVEAWNGIRALDYLESRPEIDASRIGATGRSGGGAYTWWIAALDERVSVAVPVAGITTLRNHVVDGTVEGHCDCMFHVNTHRWDFARIAALVAPRPLLISNTDRDTIFPLDGVVQVYNEARRIYRLMGVEDHIGLHIAEGPHKDVQPLRAGAFHWFNRFLKGGSPDDLLADVATKPFEPQDLKVFSAIPDDERNTAIDESFVPLAETPPIPESADDWNARRGLWKRWLETRVFAGWPEDRNAVQPAVQAVDENRWTFTSQEPFRLPVAVDRAAGAPIREVTLVVCDDEAWGQLDALRSMRRPAPGEAVAWMAPRGVGPTAWSDDERTRTQVRRRFMLLGQTLDGMRVLDVVRALEAVPRIPGLEDASIRIAARGPVAGIAVHAAIMAPEGAPLAGLELEELSRSHRDGPILLNVLRGLDLPEAVTMAAERAPVRASLAAPSPDDPQGDRADRWRYPAQVADALGWPDDRVIVTGAGD